MPLQAKQVNRIIQKCCSYIEMFWKMDALKNISNLPLYLKMPDLRLVDSRYSDSINLL